MTATAFTQLFLVALAATLALRLWLGARQIAHVGARRDAVPAAFAGRIGVDAHRKAADYTIAKQRLSRLETLADAVLLIVWTLGGGVAMLVAWTSGLAVSSLWQDLALLVLVVAIGGLLMLPFSWYQTFVIEERFGFNRMTLGMWLGDLVKGTLVAAALGVPLLLLVLWLMTRAGDLWWLWVWAAWMAFQMLVLFLYPTVIAPLFNKFTPLPQGEARTQIEALLARCGFRSTGLFVMDGSKRSAHGTAYFTGFGRAKRIVFFDTLLARLAPGEIEAVLAHELGHYVLRHVLKRVAWTALLSLAFLALLAWLAREPWFYGGLGVTDAAGAARAGVALALFVLALPVFTFALSPLSALYSRKHEFEADAFAAQNASAPALALALVKLYEDNASTLTPDPLHSAFYDSHPPAAIRIARLEALAPPATASAA